MKIKRQTIHFTLLLIACEVSHILAWDHLPPLAGVIYELAFTLCALKILSVKIGWTPPKFDRRWFRVAALTFFGAVVCALILRWSRTALPFAKFDAQILLYRQLIYGWLERSTLGAQKALWISSLVFGLSHLIDGLWAFDGAFLGFLLFQTAYTTLGGLLLGKARQISGTWWGSWPIHILANATFVWVLWTRSA